MEPLTALGLAGNVVQFVEFASGVAVAARTLYYSASGSTRENKELEMLARNFQQVAESEDIRSLAEQTESNDGGTSREDSTLKGLSKQCTQVADELIALLNSVKIKGQHRGAESVYRAVKTAWKKEDIDRLQQRLDRISNALHNYVQKTQQNRMLRQMNQLHDDNLRLQATRTTEITNLKRSFTRAFEEMASAIQEKNSKAVARVLQQLPLSVEREKKFSYEQFILSQLFYLTMENRHYAIPNEHQKTFRWIFDTPKSGLSGGKSVNFVKWLKSDSNLFWVTGKPGSGKSTLMKFLAAQSDVVSHLQESKWLDGSELVTASFFFWSSARDPLQKSQAGLLRSILYQILRKCPDLIPIAFPANKFRMENEVEDPSFLDGFHEVQTLIKAFENMSKDQFQHSKKYFFFIDGLDEYDGNTTDVIQLIETLQQWSHIRICISSRPWNEFQARFGTTQWKLSVHELTKDDIRMYVTDKLSADPVFRDLQKSDKRYPDLIQNITISANGVFLWVFLVVRSLLEGLTNADRVIDLQKRLADFPTDLESYFEKILLSVDGRYRQQMANAFIVSLEATKNLPLLCHWFFDELDEDPEYAFTLAAVGQSEDDVMQKLLQATKRLNARCRGLLEVRVSPEDPESWSVRALTWHVDFLHRTARDFLALSTMQRRLKSWADESSSVDANICNSIVALVKSAPSLTIISEFHGQLMETFFTHVERLQQQEGFSSQFAKRLPLELDQTLLQRGIHDFDLWVDPYDRTETILDRSSSRVAAAHEIDLGFMTTCASAGLSDYINCKFDQQPSLIKEIGPDLLITALIPLRENSFRGRRRYSWGAEKVDLVLLLLRRGVDPKQPHHMNLASKFARQMKLSVWQHYFSDMIDVGEGLFIGDRLLSSSAFSCSQALLVTNIDPCACIDSKDISRTAAPDLPLYQALRMVFTDEQYLSLYEKFHPETNENAAKIQKYLRKEGIDTPDDSTVQKMALEVTDRSNRLAVSRKPTKTLYPLDSRKNQRMVPIAINQSIASTPVGQQAKTNTTNPPKTKKANKKSYQGITAKFRELFGSH